MASNVYHPCIIAVYKSFGFAYITNITYRITQYTSTCTNKAIRVWQSNTDHFNFSVHKQRDANIKEYI